MKFGSVDRNGHTIFVHSIAIFVQNVIESPLVNINGFALTLVEKGKWASLLQVNVL